MVASRKVCQQHQPPLAEKHELAPHCNSFIVDVPQKGSVHHRDEQRPSKRRGSLRVFHVIQQCAAPRVIFLSTSRLRRIRHGHEGIMHMSCAGQHSGFQRARDHRIVRQRNDEELGSRTGHSNHPQTHF